MSTDWFSSSNSRSIMVLAVIATVGLSLFGEGVSEETSVGYHRSWDGSIEVEQMALLPSGVTPRFRAEYKDGVLASVTGFYIGTAVRKFEDTIVNGAVESSTYFAPDGSIVAEYRFTRRDDEIVEIRVWGPGREVYEAAGLNSRWADVRGAFLFGSSNEQLLMRGRISFEDRTRIGETNELFVDGGVARAGATVTRDTLGTRGSGPLFSRFRERVDSNEIGLPTAYSLEEIGAGQIITTEWNYREDLSTVRRVETLVPGIEDITTTYVTTAHVTDEYPGSGDFVDRSRREFSSISGGAVVELFSRGIGRNAELERYAVQAEVLDENRRVQSAEVPWESDTTYLELMLVPQGFGRVRPSRWAIGVNLPISDEVASELADTTEGKAHLPRPPSEMWVPNLHAWP